MLPSYTNYFNLNPVTTGLMTSSVWIGGIIAGFGFGWVTDKFGRRLAMFWAAFSLIIAVALQTAAQNMAMFVLARILIGFGMTAAGIAGPIYLAETMPTKWRGWSLAIFNDFFYIGKLYCHFCCLPLAVGFN
jgi:MFS family permease